MIDMTAKTAPATTATIAAALDTTPRELRKFLRSQSMGVGKGSRYALPNTKASLAKMRKDFDTWTSADAAKRAAKAATTPPVSLIKAGAVSVQEIDFTDADDAPEADDLTDAELDSLDDSIDE